MKMAFALAIQILLAEISVPAFQEEREEAEFIFFAQFGHGQSLMVNRCWLMVRKIILAFRAPLSTRNQQLSTPLSE
jgi:hypothetical protein